MKITTFTIILALLVARSAAADHVFLRPADAPRAMFPSATAAPRQSLELSDAEADAVGKAIGRKLDTRSYPYLDVRDDRGTLGAIFLLDVIGQSQPISFAVAVTSEGTIQDVRVLVYRETHGDEIEDRRFRKQFVGKALRDPIALGKDIDAISGATISSRSEAFAVRKALALSDVLHHHQTRTSRVP
jgi:Na+-translocating ferredoxin:NAD+ oxidoreductase RnfG subunit